MGDGGASSFVNGKNYLRHESKDSRTIEVVEKDGTVVGVATDLDYHQDY
jgi:hypothetical protein